jgi:hypothetical protein
VLLDVGPIEERRLPVRTHLRPDVFLFPFVKVVRWWLLHPSCLARGRLGVKSLSCRPVGSVAQVRPVRVVRLLLLGVPPPPVRVVRVAPQALQSLLEALTMVVGGGSKVTGFMKFPRM